MSHIDWDAFLDGSLSPAEMAELRQRVATDSTLQRDLAGFKAFRDETRARGQAQVVPIALLEAGLRSVARPAKPTFWQQNRRALLMTPLVAIGLAYLFVSRSATPEPDPLPRPGLFLATTCSDATKVVSGATEGIAWLTEKTHLKIPALDLTGLAQIKSVEYGQEWAKMNLSADDQLMRLTMAKKDNFEGHGTEIIQGMEFFADNYGLAWRQGGLSYYVDGCEPKRRREIACAIRKQLGPVELRRGRKASLE